MPRRCWRCGPTSSSRGRRALRRAPSRGCGRSACEVVEIPTFRLADVATALRSVGRIAGTEAVAEEAARRYEVEIRDLRASHAGVRRVGVFVEIDDEPLYTVNGRHVISEVVELCGGSNVFADLPQLAPPVAIEAVLARDPEVILSTDDTISDPAALWRRWSGMKAVKAGSIYSMSSDTLTRSTPRLAVGAGEVCAALDDARRRLKHGDIPSEGECPLRRGMSPTSDDARALRCRSRGAPARVPPRTAGPTGGSGTAGPRARRSRREPAPRPVARRDA